MGHNDHGIFVLKGLIAIVFASALGILVYTIVASAPQLSTGVVVDKLYTPAHTSQTTTYVKSGDAMVPSTSTTFYNERYEIIVIGEKPGGEQRKESWNVTVFQYQRACEGMVAHRNPKTGDVSLDE